MHIFDFVSVKLTLFLIFGIVLGFYLEPQPLPVLLCLGLSIIMMIGAWKMGHFFGWATFFTMICLGILITLFKLGKVLPHHYSNANIDKIGAWNLKIEEVLKPNQYQRRYVVCVDAFENKKCTGRLILHVPRDSMARSFYVDDKITGLGKLEDIQGPLNPHQFSYKDYLKKQGIHHQISISPKSVQKQKFSTPTLYGLAMSIREKIVFGLSQEKFGEAEFGVIQALLLGKRDGITESTYTDYKNAGAVHILAVSGLHVGVLLLLFQFLLKPLRFLRYGKTIQLAFVVLLLWGFAFIAGLSPSVVRAVTMFSFLAYAQYLNRPTNSFNIIALSMLFMLLVNPLFLFQVGFQMSYAAVFFIVWVYPKLQKLWLPEQFLIRKVWQLISVSVAAQLGVLPISLFYFHQFPGLFFISNVLIIPFLSIILGGGLLTIVLSLCDALPDKLVIGYNYLIRGMNTIISWVANQEQFVLQEIPMDGIQMIFIYVIIFSMVLFLSKPKFKVVLAIFLGIAGLQVWGIWKVSKTRDKPTFLIAHTSRSPLFVHKKGKHLIAMASDSSHIKTLVTRIKIGEQMDTISYTALGNIYDVKRQKIYRADRFAIFPPEIPVDILWLTESPKINMERWLDSLKPKRVIMDGTNYKSYTARWKKSCQNKKVSFHDTREKGAYAF